MSFLPFARPSITEAEINEIHACLESGWLTTGPRVQHFEQDLTAYFQRAHAISLSSATAGLQLALEALELPAGSEIITTPMTFVATLNSIIHAGHTPVLVDVCPKTYNIDLNLIEQAITPKTRAIMPVHFAGLPVDNTQLYQLAEKHQLRVIEDCAHAIGAQHSGKLIGQAGDIQVFSFHPNKNMTTGEGGCVVTDDDDLAARIRTLRFHGINRDVSNRFAKDGSQLYDVITPGYKYNMMDLQAALGIHQLQRLPQFIERRGVLAKRYITELAEFSWLQLPAIAKVNDLHAWHLFAPLVNSDEISRDELMSKLKEQGIGTGLHYQAVHLFSYYQQKYHYRIGDFPRAEHIANNIFSLPLFFDMTDEQQTNVIQSLIDVMEQVCI